MNLVEAIHERALKVANSFQKAETELLEVLLKVEDHAVCRKLGYSSLFQYCVSCLKLSENNAFNLITVVRKSRTVPKLKEAVVSGEITLSKARRIAPVITSANQEEWIEKAKVLPQRLLEKAIVKEKPQELVPEKITYKQENRIELKCGISEELLKQIERAKDLLSQKLKKPVTLEETLDFAFKEFLEKNDPVLRAERNLKSLGTCRVESLKDGKRVALPVQVKHQVNHRDQGQCTFILPNKERCQEGRWIELHHKLPVSHGGSHHPENIATLCYQHHALHHQ